MMRIITGRARGTRLATLPGDATRPTSERAKEALFSMVQFDIAGSRVLDLFAGTGQLALEALSRGAERAVLVDGSAAAIDIIRRNAEKTHFSDKCDIIRADYAEASARLSGKESFNLVFLDPPYHKGLVTEALGLLLSYNLLAPYATVVCESEDAGGDVIAGLHGSDAFEVRKISRYGIARVTLLCYSGRGI